MPTDLKQLAHDAVAQYRGRPIVFVILMNGAILGVVNSEDLALEEARQLRSLYPGIWSGSGSQHWFHAERHIELTISAHTVVG